MDEALSVRVVESPLGAITIRASGAGVVAVAFEADAPETVGPGDRFIHQAARELAEYFAGTRREFGVALAPDGTAFQRRVWDRLAAVRWGERVSYDRIARETGSVARAVGQANAANPIAILIPCHRVVRASGDLGGYAGGLDRKQRLLELEGARLFAGVC